MSSAQRRFTKRALLASSILTILPAGAAYAQSQRAPASASAADQAPASADASAGDIVVTGSRVVRDGSQAPTPVTVVSTEQLAATTPSNLPDALNKLPVFQGSQRPRAAGSGGANVASNVLSLRGFGAQRTLVLLNGHRITPSNANGTVDVDSIPQMIVSRVDVVTGGASAVYGSDAVTGVVNFILDNKFSGLKTDANIGVSTYGDGMSYKLGAAYGMKLGDRGHITLAGRHFRQDDVDAFERPYGQRVFVLTGGGTAANPFRISENVRRADSAFGGKIQSCVAPCSVSGQQFVANGVIGPFNPGVATGTANQNIGGDGAYSVFSTAIVALRTDEGFGRFDYEVTDNINFYAQAIYAEAFSSGFHFPAKLTPVGSGPTVTNSTASVFFKNNPFLTAQAQAQLGNNGRTDNTNVFSVGTYIVNDGQTQQTGTRNLNKHIDGMAGLNGSLGKFKWDLYYTHGENRLRVDNLNNSNYQKQFAALDAVVANGTIQCYAATQAATASAYAGCVPLNAFGPTAITPAMFAYFTGTTFFKQKNVMDDAAASISGDLFSLWAGPISVALSGEARWNTYKVTSNASPSALVDCTGLRICNPTLPLWAQPVVGEIEAKNNVWEVAAEAEVPLLRDVMFARSLSLNLAGRQTHYSTSGSVRTWKIGASWDVFDGLRFRGTTSQDIRAPTLDDLFRPATSSVGGFVDLHTNTSNTVYTTTRGNPNLKPEKARTYTGGVVLQPSFLPGFTASVDYYQIKLDNAIGSISPSSNSVQKLCEDSGGSSPYCALFERPLPFSNTTSANFPTRVFSQVLNTALTKIRGWDFEASYVRPGLNVRLFANYQPKNYSVAFPGAAQVRVSAPKTRVTGFVSKDFGNLRIGVEDSWLSGFSLVTQDGQVYENDHVRSFNSVDLNLELKFPTAGKNVTGYFTVQNLFNRQPGIVPPSGSIGLTYPVPAGQDVMGRYFTIGIRTRF